MNQIFQHTLPIFLTILMGSGIKRYWLPSEAFWHNLEKLSYFLLFPIALFNYVSSANFTAINQTKLILALVIASTIVALGLIILRIKKNIDPIQFTSIFQGSIRYNSYIFFGLGNALFGTQGVTIVAIISAYMVIFVNTASILVFNFYIPSDKDKSRNSPYIILISRIFTNPLIIASITGFIFNYSKLEFFFGFKKFLDTLSDSTLTIGAITVGASLKFSLHSTHLIYLIIANITKLIILPIVAGLTLKIFQIKGVAREIGILYSCLPCASSAYVLSKQLGGDPESMSAIITTSTAFSILSLPLVMYILT